MEEELLSQIDLSSCAWHMIWLSGSIYAYGVKPLWENRLQEVMQICVKNVIIQRLH